MNLRSISILSADFLACIGVLALLAWSSDRTNLLFASAEAAACILVELGNGERFIFDMGTGSMERLYALGIP